MGLYPVSGIAVLNKHRLGTKAECRRNTAGACAENSRIKETEYTWKSLQLDFEVAVLCNCMEFKPSEPHRHVCMSAVSATYLSTTKDTKRSNRCFTIKKAVCSLESSCWLKSTLRFRTSSSACSLSISWFLASSSCRRDSTSFWTLIAMLRWFADMVDYGSRQRREISTVRSKHYTGMTRLENRGRSKWENQAKAMGTATLETCQGHNTATCMTARSLRLTSISASYSLAKSFVFLFCFLRAPITHAWDRQWMEDHVAESSSDAHCWKPRAGWHRQVFCRLQWWCHQAVCPWLSSDSQCLQLQLRSQIAAEDSESADSWISTCRTTCRTRYRWTESCANASTKRMRLLGPVQRSQWAFLMKHTAHMPRQPQQTTLAAASHAPRLSRPFLHFAPSCCNIASWVEQALKCGFCRLGHARELSHG